VDAGAREPPGVAAGVVAALALVIAVGDAVVSATAAGAAELGLHDVNTIATPAYVKAATHDLERSATRESADPTTSEPSCSDTLTSTSSQIAHLHKPCERSMPR